MKGRKIARPRGVKSTHDTRFRPATLLDRATNNRRKSATRVNLTPRFLMFLRASIKRNDLSSVAPR